MDNVLVDFPSGISKISKALQSEYEDNLDEVPGIFSLMAPIKGAIESYKKLSQPITKKMNNMYKYFIYSLFLLIMEQILLNQYQ